MKILIVEDEKSIANRIERLLKEIAGDKISSLVQKERLTEALDYINHHKIDLLFLDLNLSGNDGFEILQSLAAETFDTIIVSAYRDKAIDAYEYGVVDFVPKPFTKDRLAKAFHRLDSNRPDVKKIVIKKQGRLKIIPVSDLLYIQGANIYSELYLKDGNKELSDLSLERFEKLLPDRFMRIHKSYIVDITHASEIILHPGSKYELKISPDLVLPIGRTKYKEVKKVITDP